MAGRCRHGAADLAIVLTYAVGVRNGSVGVESSATSFFGELLPRFDRVTIAGLANRVDPVAALAYLAHERLDFDPVAYCTQTASTSSRLGLYLAALPRILRRVAQSDYFYIFAPSHISLLFMLACVLLRKRYAVYLRGDWEAVSAAPVRRMKKWLLRRADFVIVTGEGFFREVSAYHPLCAKVVPMMLFTSTTEPFERSFSLERRIRLLFVGQVIEAKGVFDLLSAFRALRAEYPGLELTIVGDGNALQMLRDEITAAGLDGTIRCAGHVTDAKRLSDFYKDADIFVLPTYFPEGFPRVLYEAMLYSLPIVTTNAGGIGGAMVSGENCVIVRQRDPTDLQRAITRMIADEKLRRATGRAGHRMVVDMLRELKADRPSHASQFLAMADRCGWPVCADAGRLEAPILTA